MTGLIALRANINEALRAVSARRRSQRGNLDCFAKIKTLPRNDNILRRHSRESGNPVAFDFFCKALNSKWIPAYAGMTEWGMLVYLTMGFICKFLFKHLKESN